MKSLLLVLALLAASAAHGGQKVYDPASGVYVDMDTGEVYPRVAPNVAIDTNTGRAFVPAAEPDLPSCSQVRTAISRVEASMRGRDTSAPDYAVTYGKWQSLQQYAANYCR